MPAFLGYFDGVFLTFLNTNILWFNSKSGSLISIFSINSIPKVSIAAFDSSNSKLAFGPFKHIKYPPTFTNGTQNSINIGNPATALAAAGLPALMEFCVPFVKVGGHFVCLKGPNANLELEESKKAMEVLGIEYIEKIDIKLPEIDLDHNILVFKKVKNTPSKYPRKAGKVTKNPIK